MKEASTPATSAAPTTRRRVLIIEDDADIAEAITYQLEKAGLQVKVARTGEEGLDAARRGADLILLDLNLPGMDGLEVCRMIRRQQATAHVPLIIVSARAEEVDRVLGLEMGAAGERLLGVQVRQLLAVLGWAAVEFDGEPLSLVASGRTAAVIAAAAAALFPKRLDSLLLEELPASLKLLIEERSEYEQEPELFCFGLLQQFDIRELLALATARQIRLLRPQGPAAGPSGAGPRRRGRRAEGPRLPDPADLHDGRPWDHRARVGADPDQPQPRAHRRPCHQHRGRRDLPGRG